MFILSGHRPVTYELNIAVSQSNRSGARDGIQRTTFSYSGLLKTYYVHQHLEVYFFIITVRVRIVLS
jgi:hypothetical protein